MTGEITKRDRSALPESAVELIYITDPSYLVITNGVTQDVEVVVVPTGGAGSDTATVV